MAHQETSVSLRFSVRIGTGSPGDDGGSYVVDDRISGYVTEAPNKAKKTMRATVAEAVEAGLDAAEYQDVLTVIVCGDGTVLVLRRLHKSWMYEIFGENRGSTSVCTSDTYGDILARARNHAGESYGGILWANIHPPGIVFERKGSTCR